MAAIANGNLSKLILTVVSGLLIAAIIGGATAWRSFASDADLTKLEAAHIELAKVVTEHVRKDDERAATAEAIAGEQKRLLERIERKLQ